MITGMMLLHMQQVCIWILRRWVARNGGRWNSNKITSTGVGGGEPLGVPEELVSTYKNFAIKPV